MAKKTVFQIPSVDDIAKFEKEQPKFQSHFLTSKEPKSTVIDSKDKAATTALNKSASHSNGLSKVNTSSSTNSSNNEQSKRKGAPLPTAGEESRKRPAGSSFAAKFGSLPHVEGKVNQPMKPQSTSKTNAGITKPVASAKASSTVTNSKNTTNCILVNPRQRGNPILKSVRNIPWEFGDIVPDYVMGRTICALFLSLRYHHLNPNYIHSRLKELGNNYELRILLVQVDVKDPHYSLKELARMAILAECTLILAWSPEEAGRYLETYKSYEHKPIDALKERIEQDFVSQVTDCLTTVKSVNRTDVVTLLSTFGTVANIVSAEKDELNLLPGFGPQKALRLHDVFQEPFHKQP
ncbi:putative DNA excision repair protein ERCC-1 [Apostichopus japonicus]|uniref:DNA excision repair protein ERCC-1 n=1 Tax=Stichopus japonicus TaxID=307972 RepID=A0A2G8JUQ5_STIJA|nr:putative DNA excision repair protein ERCC-1 [Apostichopus japonicus]